ncbi:MAG: alpha/beta hydrolase [Acidimicrobiales bacterium]|jgi:pimeloyl-ACP methyl ester carboxylesterase
MPSPSQLAVTEYLPEGSSHAVPIVVLVHGSLDRSSSFARVLRRLDDLHTVVYDRRGYHGSRRAFPLNTTLAGHVDDLLEVIGGRPAVVVGHSYGGDVALGAALRHGNDGSIRSVGAYEPPMPWLDLWPTRPAGGQEQGTGDPVERDARGAERFFRRMMGDAAWDRLPEKGKAERRADGPALLAELDAIRIAEAPFDVTDMTIPTLYARGATSASRHREAVVWLVEHTPDAELVEFPGAGHGAHLTHPDAFAAMVRRTLALADAPAQTAPAQSTTRQTAPEQSTTATT